MDQAREMREWFRNVWLLVAEFAQMNAVYTRFFVEPYPASAAFQVAAPPRDVKSETETVAVK